MPVPGTNVAVSVACPAPSHRVRARLRAAVAPLGKHPLRAVLRSAGELGTPIVCSGSVGPIERGGRRHAARGRHTRTNSAGTVSKLTGAPTRNAAARPAGTLQRNFIRKPVTA